MEQTKVDISHQPQTATDFGVSYFLAIDMPLAVADSIEDHMMTVAREIGEGFYVQPARSLHITVIDFIDAIIDPTKHGYKNKAEVWAKIGPQCQAAIEKAIKGVKPFTIAFDELRVSDAAVILVGHDSGQLQKVRDDIMREIGDLRLPRTKLPSHIIHCSVGRYTKVMDIEPIRATVAAEPLAFTMPVARLQLRNQLVVNMLEYTDVKVYDLPVNGV